VADPERIVRAVEHLGVEQLAVERLEPGRIGRAKGDVVDTEDAHQRICTFGTVPSHTRAIFTARLKSGGGLRGAPGPRLKRSWLIRT
jgi:hypothetical protein